jgi:hypothetical protein
MKYTIYHIPGVKIGCSKNPNLRVKMQGYSNYEILEVHNDINSASIREIELQKEYGYRIDSCNYVNIIERRKTAYPIGLAKAHKNSCKPIYVYEYNTNKLIGEYDSLWIACKILDINQGNATSVIKGRYKQTSGYYFKYKNLVVTKK